MLHCNDTVIYLHVKYIHGTRNSIDISAHGTREVVKTNRNLIHSTYPSQRLISPFNSLEWDTVLDSTQSFAYQYD